MAPSHPQVYLTRGFVRICDSKPGPAAVCFTKALALQRSLTAYKGLCSALVGMSKHRDAVVRAKQAVVAMPGDARALVLLGHVLATAGHHDEVSSTVCFSTHTSQ